MPPMILGHGFSVLSADGVLRLCQAPAGPFPLRLDRPCRFALRHSVSPVALAKGLLWRKPLTSLALPFVRSLFHVTFLLVCPVSQRGRRGAVPCRSASRLAGLPPDARLLPCAPEFAIDLPPRLAGVPWDKTAILIPFSPETFRRHGHAMPESTPVSPRPTPRNPIRLPDGSRHPAQPSTSTPSSNHPPDRRRAITLTPRAHHPPADWARISPPSTYPLSARSGFGDLAASASRRRCDTSSPPRPITATTQFPPIRSRSSAVRRGSPVRCPAPGPDTVLGHTSGIGTRAVILPRCPHRVGLQSSGAGARGGLATVPPTA